MKWDSALSFVFLGKARRYVVAVVLGCERRSLTKERPENGCRNRYGKGY